MGDTSKQLFANSDLHEKAADCYHRDGRYIKAAIIASCKLVSDTHARSLAELANLDLHEKAAECYHWDGRYVEAAILEHTSQGNGHCLTCKRYTCKKCSGIGKDRLFVNSDLHEKAADCYHWDGRYVEAELFANSDLHEKAADCYHWDGRYIEAAILEQTPQGNGQCLTCKRYTCKKCSGIGKKQLFVNSDLHEKAADCYHWDGRYIEAAIIEHTSQGNGHCLVSDIHATSGG